MKIASLLASLLLTCPPLVAQECSMSRVDVHPGGAEPLTGGLSGVLSWDGRFVAFESTEPLIPGETMGPRQIFVRDRLLGTLERVSRSITPPWPKAHCVNASVSADGRIVAYQSAASNIVANDINGAVDIFVFDRHTGATSLASGLPGGQFADEDCQLPDLSADGAHVAFASLSSGLVPDDHPGWDVFVYHLADGRTRLVSRSSGGMPGNRGSSMALLSADGRFAAFQSLADNLSPGDTNTVDDIFVRDLRLGLTERVSVGQAGAQANGASQWPSISDDGRFVAFQSHADNLVPDDTNGVADVFVHDRALGRTVRVSVSNAGLQGNASSGIQRISADGRRVAFESLASNLVPGDTNGVRDIFVHDLGAQTTERWNVAWDGGEASWHSNGPEISGDGLSVLFVSSAVNIVPGDTNGQSDTFVRDCRHRPSAPYCSAKTNSLGCVPSITTNGAPSGLAGFDFEVTATNVLNSKPGILLFSTSGDAALPFQGGLLCMSPPIRRAGVQDSGGTAPPALDCSGVYSVDFNALIGSGAWPELTPSTRVWTQYWSRDPGFPAPNASGLSDAIAFRIGW